MCGNAVWGCKRIYIKSPVCSNSDWCGVIEHLQSHTFTYTRAQPRVLSAAVALEHTIDATQSTLTLLQEVAQHTLDENWFATIQHTRTYMCC
jgi:hypothetical protein